MWNHQFRCKGKCAAEIQLLHTPHKEHMIIGSVNHAVIQSVNHAVIQVETGISNLLQHIYHTPFHLLHCHFLSSYAVHCFSITTFQNGSFSNCLLRHFVYTLRSPFIQTSLHINSSRYVRSLASLLKDAVLSENSMVPNAITLHECVRCFLTSIPKCTAICLAVHLHLSDILGLMLSENRLNFPYGQWS